MKTEILKSDMQKLLKAEKLIMSIQNSRTEKSKILVQVIEQIYKLEDIIKAQADFLNS